MQEWTEQQEQQMIMLAKEGDPKANYELSLWALRRSEEEPDEPRWNRLAAKCLVKAAQLGYAPARERMEQLLHGSRDESGPKPVPSEPEETPAPREPVRFSDARAAAQARRGRAPAPESTARRSAPVSFSSDDEEDEDDGEQPDLTEEEDETPARGLRFSRGGRAEEEAPSGAGEEPVRSSRWGEAQWRRMEFICVAVCAALLVLIAVMIITSHGGSNAGGSVNSAIPPAADANTAGGTDSAGTAGGDAGTAGEDAAQEEYPSAETIADIQAADLELFPAESEYVRVPTTATVKVDSQSLRLRKGPSTTYTPPICSMEDGTVVSIYAKKENWSLVLYEGGEDGPVYGWCSSEYLIVTAGAADGSSVG